ncbi:hypothetical protein [Mycolicibacterium houstonense]|uniref:hypothetical protein n=1 Tax=Mycolicibacterium houstonense TaxID=146021 RepID=UPI00082B10BF|nr:hypothetical protein [Mycolicibacterium houstonense]
MSTINPEDYQFSIEQSGADIDAMVTGYLECQLWAQHDEGNRDEETGESNYYPLDANYSVDDIAPEYVQAVRDELTEVVAQHPLAVRMYLASRRTSEEPFGTVTLRNEVVSAYLGHDFYLTREGHGAGFWDRGLGELGDYLTKIAKSYGSAATLWDNGEGVLNSLR